MLARDVGTLVKASRLSRYRSSIDWFSDDSTLGESRGKQLLSLLPEKLILHPGGLDDLKAIALDEPYKNPLHFEFLVSLAAASSSSNLRVRGTGFPPLTAGSRASPSLAVATERSL